MIEIDGSQYSGSGTIVRQAVAFPALIGQPVHIVHARTRWPKPGLRHQHIRIAQAIGELVNGTAEGLSPGSQEIIFRPGTLRTGRRYLWDIGTAGSTTMLGLGILPVLAFASSAVTWNYEVDSLRIVPLRSFIFSTSCYLFCTAWGWRSSW